MNLAHRMTKRQMVLLALIFVALLVSTLLIIHTAMPSIWHVIAYRPNILNRQP